MHQKFLYAAYGVLFATGVLHFIIDVISQYVRGVRAPSPETTLYYGLHSAYSLGQVVFGLLAILVVHSGSRLMSQPVGLALGFIALAGWFVICLLFVEYTPPKINLAIVAALLVAAVATR